MYLKNYEVPFILLILLIIWQKEELVTTTEKDNSIDDQEPLDLLIFNFIVLQIQGYFKKWPALWLSR